MAALTGTLFYLQVELAVETLDAFRDHLASALDGWWWPTAIGLESPSKLKRPKRLPASPEPSLEALVQRIDQLAKQPAQVSIYFSERSLMHWGPQPDGKSFFLGLWIAPTDDLYEDPNVYILTFRHLVRGLLARGVVTSAVVDRLGDADACVPFVPIAKTRVPLVVTDDAEVADAYERPDEFWSAGWRIERFGRQALLTRCETALEKGEVLDEIIDHQWQMARAAKPGRTAYGAPVVAPDEKATFESGDPRLQLVGVSSAGLVEYSCVLIEGEHIRGYEIYYLRELVHNKRFRDGKPLTAVRVVFLERWMAESERRPLLDIGAQVFYEDGSTGGLVELR